MSYTVHRQGPDESRYIIEAETGRFVARMDNEATDEECHMLANAAELMTVVALYQAAIGNTGFSVSRGTAEVLFQRADTVLANIERNDP